MALEALLDANKPAGPSGPPASRLNAGQLGGEFLSWLHFRRSGGGAGLERAGGQDLSRPQLVCLTSPTSLRRGHTLLAQAAEALPDGTLAIRVYDPNAPEARAPQGADAPGWLYVHRASSTWRYRMADGSRWSGGPEGPGELSWVPDSVVRADAAPFVTAATPPQSPRALIFVEGDAHTARLTDTRGSLFVDDAPAGFDPDDPDWLAAPQDRPAVSWWTAFGGLGAPGPGDEVYIATMRTGAQLRHRLRGMREAPYAYHVLQREGTVTLRGMVGAHGEVAMEATQGLPRLRVEMDRRQAVDVTFTAPIADPPAVRTFHIANLVLRPGAAVTLAVDPAGRRLSLQNTGAATTADVSLEVRRSREITRRTFAHQALSAGERMTFAPSNWDRLDEAGVPRLASVLPCRDEQEQLGA